MNESRETNKHKRKHSKYKNILLKETGIKASDEPSKHIMVCNAGLVSGIGECDVVEVFSNYGQIESTTMLLGKSYSFITFAEVCDAVNAFENINGLNVFPKMNGPVYLLFTESVPDAEIPPVTSLPDGLHLIEDFVTEEEELLLLNCVTWTNIEQTDILGKTVLKHRRVRHYGYEFKYENNNVDKKHPMTEKIPNECNIIFDRLRDGGYQEIVPWTPDQLTVNEYQPGQGIPSHVDTHSAFESPIMSLSLGSDTVMEFRHRNGQHIPLLLPRRSLLIMGGESRYDWSHGITPRKIDVIKSPNNGLTTKTRTTRTSFTFRKILFDDCHCNYPFHCDSQKSDSETLISNSDASRLESIHVHQVYEEISSHFSETRHKPWPNVAHFVNSLQPGAFLVDVGCGNGKYFRANKNIFEVGCDRSIHLSEECHDRGNEVFTCNCLQLPIRSNCVDGVISIAVIHHLATYERRLFAIKEMIRILSVGGQGLVYVWAKDQRKDQSMSSYLKQDRKNRRSGGINNDSDNISTNSDNTNTGSEFQLPVHTNRTQFQHEDLLVPWKLKKNNDKIFYRYYHVFKEHELENMFLSINDIKIIKSYYDQGNWCVHFEKIKCL